MGGFHFAKRHAGRLGRAVAWLPAWAVAASCLATTVWASPPARDTVQGNTSKEAKQSALQSIPFHRIAVTDQAKLRSVLNDVTLFRRMPIRVMECDRQMYLFLLEHPDLVVNVWQVLGLSKLEVRQSGERTFEFNDHGGTVGTAEIIYQTPEMHIVYAEGRYQGPPLVRAARGRCVAVIASDYGSDYEGHSYVTTRMDSFVSIDHQAVELFTKAFESLVGKVADANFVQSVAFLGSMSYTAKANPTGVERLARRLDRVDPEVQTQFATIARQVASRELDQAIRRGVSTAPIAPAATMARGFNESRTK